jgi:phosphoglycolate phosphatase
MFSLVVFDLDGTLIDSIGDLAIAVNLLVAEHGGRVLAQAEVATMVGEGARLLVSRAFAAAGVTSDPHAVLPRFAEIYESLLPGQTRPYPGVPAMLDGAGRVATLAVLSNKPTSATRKILALLGIDHHFLEILGGDGPFPRKPHADGLRHLMARAGAAPASTLMVGDSTVDLRTAQAAQARACIARYGFGQLTFVPGDLRGDEFFVDDPHEILAILS